MSEAVGSFSNIGLMIIPSFVSNEVSLSSKLINFKTDCLEEPSRNCALPTIFSTLPENWFNVWSMTLGPNLIIL